MKLSEFEIGKSFYTATGEWICVDKATKCILAMKVVPEKHIRTQDMDNEDVTRIIGWEQLLKDPFTYGDIDIMDTSDWGGCYAEQRSKSEIKRLNVLTNRQTKKPD